MTQRVAVLGLGVMGRQHLRILSELDDVEVVGACDASPDAHRSAAAHGDFPFFGDWREVVALRPDAIVNALPTGLHFEVTKECLLADIHVLVEKPIATTVREASELAELAQKHGVVLLVGHVERFNPTVALLKQLVQDDRIGNVVSASARRVGVARPTIPHANVALDLAIHDIDSLSYVLGRDGKLLLAAGSSIASNQLEDHIDIVIRYGETIASIQANWITPVKIRRLSLTGTKGFLEADYINQSISIFESVPELIKGVPWDFFAVSTESEPTRIDVDPREPLRSELEHFLACIRTGAPPLSDALSATRALALAIDATNATRGVGVGLSV